MKKVIFAFIALICFNGVAFATINTATCTGCHGKDFKKSAMGKSKIVAKMSHKDVVKALLGYKDGTYGGSMKSMMKGQISRYSDEEIKNINLGEKSFTEKVKSATKNAVEKTKKVAKSMTTKTIVVAKKAKDKVSKYLEKDYSTKVVLSSDYIYGYKNNSNCFVVDYKNKKAKALDCSRLKSAAELKDKSLVPPTIGGDIPNPFEELLK